MVSDIKSWIRRVPLKNKIIISGLINLIGFNLVIITVSDVTNLQLAYGLLNIGVWLVNLFICFKSRDIEHSYRYMTIYGLVSIGIGAAVNGGMYSSYIFWLPIISLGMSIFSDRALALACLLFSVLLYTVFMMLQMFGLVDFYKQAGKIPLLLDYANFISCIVMLWIIHYFFLTKERISFMWGKINERKVEDLEHKLSQKELEMEKMRSDMAKDFHDEMGNKLASISILSQTLAVQLGEELSVKDRERLKMLETIEVRAKEMYQGTKDFIWSVDYKSDFVLEIFIYLREFGESFFNQIDIDFKSEYKIDESIPHRLEPLMGRHCILICKEIMTNAAKYSHTPDFIFEMELKGDMLYILLEDNGAGFDIALVEKRGLSHINHRSRMIKADLGFESDEGGTRYQIGIPLAC